MLSKLARSKTDPTSAENLKVSLRAALSVDRTRAPRILPQVTGNTNRNRRFQQHNRTLALLILGIIGLLGSCARDPSDPFRNPTFRCPSRDVVEPGEGYPYPVSGGERSVRELKDFCKRMDRRFDASNLTVGEAERFYALLKANNETMLPSGRHLLITNGYYGMPGGSSREPFVFEEQVRLKKLSEEKYEVFYYHIECGLNYSHMEFYLENGTLVGYEYLDYWRENFPC